MRIVLPISKIILLVLFLNEDSGIDGDNVTTVSKQWVDIHLLDFRGEAEQSGETHDDLGIFLFIDAFLATRTF